MNTDRKSQIIFSQAMTHESEKEDPGFSNLIEEVRKNTGVNLKLTKDSDGRAVLVETFRVEENFIDTFTGYDG